MILLRDNLLTDGWEQIDFPSSDVTALRIKGSWGKLTIFNIYNDCNHDDTLELLSKYHKAHYKELLGNTETQSKHHVVWVGDFNRHHPHWDNPLDTRLFTRTAISNAEALISAVTEAGLDLALPPGIPTHLHNVTKCWTRLDQVFISEDTLELIITCETLPNSQV